MNSQTKRSLLAKKTNQQLRKLMKKLLFTELISNFQTSSSLNLHNFMKIAKKISKFRSGVVQQNASKV
jgi:hypothetical protein